MFDRIPQDPGGRQYRHGGTIPGGRQEWFRGKTGNGRYRLFYRYNSVLKIVVYVWINDENSLRTRGRSSDAYAVFGGMLDTGYPPADWDTLLEQAMREAKKSLSVFRKPPR